MKRVLFNLIVIFSLLIAQSINAEVKLPAIVSSNMVLQRNTTVVLWGWADANEKIEIKPSWSDNLNVVADKDGNWKVEVKTTNSKEPQSIKIKSETSNITLENILFGEVWLCSGQSNMEQPVKGFRGQPVFGSLNAIAKSQNKNLRLFTVGKTASKTPNNKIEKYVGWESANPDNVKNFGAVAYFFGKQLQEILDVPVGMIYAVWGNSIIEAWMSKESLTPYQKVNLDKIDVNRRPYHTPTVIYNGLINPIIPYTIRGVLWYQGESNSLHPQEYKKLFPAMVKDWRKRWGIGNFPFYYVQIAPFLGNNIDKYETFDNSAFMREVQLQCLDLIPNSGIAITLDIGEKFCVHPPKKKEVADRLLYIALNKTYGFKSIDYASPIYKSKEVKNGGIILKFNNAKEGLFSYNGLKGFEIAGEDKVFYPANAKLVDGRRNVFVKSDKVPNPVAVRYGWSRWTIGTLYDSYLLPAPSFRTDNWNDATKFKEKQK